MTETNLARAKVRTTGVRAFAGPSMPPPKSFLGAPLQQVADGRFAKTIPRRAAARASCRTARVARRAGRESHPRETSSTCARVPHQPGRLGRFLDSSQRYVERHARRHLLARLARTACRNGC